MSNELSLSAEVSADQLSRGEWVRLVWGFLWRGLAFTIMSGILGGLLGFIVGVVAGVVCRALGVPPETYAAPLKVVVAVISGLLGLWLITFYIRWLLRSRFGSLRLALMRA